MEEGRRLSIRVWRIWRWFLVTMLAAYALLHDPDVGAAGPWVFRVAVGVTFALIAAYVVTMVRGMFWMVRGTKRGLVFKESRSAPFGKSRWMPRGWLILIAAWFGGLILLIAVSLS